MVGGHSTAQRLAARARRERERLGEPSPADSFTTNQQWRQFDQNMAALTYIDAATDEYERIAAVSYIV